MSEFKVAVVAHNDTGLNIIRYLLENYPQDVVKMYVVDLQKKIIDYLKSVNFNEFTDMAELNSDSGKEELKKLNLDTIILAGCQKILKNDIISIPKLGIINLHPALLTHNAGMHANFWNLIEERPFGVTIHFIDEGIDTGDIIFQKHIEKTWEDTGVTLFNRALNALVELFEESYPAIREGKYSRKTNNRDEGSFHYSKELFEKIKLNLDDKYTLREFLNLLRAQDFPQYQGCTFKDNGEEYEVRIKIKKLTK